MEHLQKSYGGSTPLRDVNAVVRRGEVIAVIGPSGSGKSSLLRCLNRLEPPTAGRITVLGRELTGGGAELAAVRQRMGMVFQSFQLFPHLTALENVTLAPIWLRGLPPQQAAARGMALLQAVGLGERARKYPGEMSGGQQQRVAIARALAMEPEILLLDEPTSNLDPASAGEVLSVIRRLAAQGMTMMVVTHEMQFAREAATRVFYMDQGVLYEEGTPAQLLDAPRRNRTRAFVQRLRVLHFAIDSPGYDFIAMAQALQQFGEKHLRPRRRVEGLHHAFEEIAAANIVPRLAPGQTLHILTEYAESADRLEMRFLWGGAPCNPLEEGEPLSLRLVKAFLAGSRYDYADGENRLTVQI